MLYEELSGDVIGAAMEVLNELKPGLDEKLHENALVVELLQHGRRVNQQARFDVQYKSHLVGILIHS